MIILFAFAFCSRIIKLLGILYSQVSILEHYIMSHDTVISASTNNTTERQIKKKERETRAQHTHNRSSFIQKIVLKLSIALLHRFETLEKPEIDDRQSYRLSPICRVEIY